MTYNYFPFVRSSRPVSSSVLRTGSGQNGPAYGSEPLSSPAVVGQSTGIWRVVAGKCTCTPLTIPFQLTKTSSFRPTKPDNKKGPLRIFIDFHSVLCFSLLLGAGLFPYHLSTVLDIDIADEF